MQKLNKAYSEILEILNNMKPKCKRKIPKKVVDFLRENSDKDYEFHIDLSIPLKEQKLEKKTISLLAMIYLYYLCDTEEEKKEAIQRYYNNDKKQNLKMKKRDY